MLGSPRRAPARVAAVAAVAVVRTGEVAGGEVARGAVVEVAGPPLGAPAGARQTAGAPRRLRSPQLRPELVRSRAALLAEENRGLQ